MTPTELASLLNNLFTNLIKRAGEVFPNLSKSDQVDIADLIVRWFYERIKLVIYEKRSRYLV